MPEARVVNPLVDQFRKGGVPRDLRVVAAQGALPLKPSDLVELVHFLLADADAEIRGAAAATLAGLPVAEWLPILKDRETLPEVLSWGLTHRAEQALREVALQNHAIPDETIMALAGTLPEPLAELVVINQTRLLRSTPLLEVLEANPNLNKDQQRRLRELRETFKIGVVEAPPPPPPPPAPPPPAPAAEAPPEVEEAPPATDDEAVVRYLSDEERQETDKVSAVQRLYRLNTAQKVIAALKGSREERAILVRDPNRIVASAVLGSPRTTDAEIESFAAMKNVSGDVLRHIGNHKEWTKRYGVVISLVRNPRTPIAISIGMVSRLNPRDLKNITVDRNVPEVIRKQAQKFVKGPDGKK